MKREFMPANNQIPGKECHSCNVPLSGDVQYKEVGLNLARRFCAVCVSETECTKCGAPGLTPHGKTVCVDCDAGDAK